MIIKSGAVYTGFAAHVAYRDFREGFCLKTAKHSLAQHTLCNRKTHIFFQMPSPQIDKLSHSINYISKNMIIAY
jgi:hypothetical protein